MINLGTINQKPVLQIFTHYFEPSLFRKLNFLSHISQSSDDLGRTSNFPGELARTYTSETEQVIAFLSQVGHV